MKSYTTRAGSVITELAGSRVNCSDCFRSSSRFELNAGPFTLWIQSCWARHFAAQIRACSSAQATTRRWVGADLSFSRCTI